MNCCCFGYSYEASYGESLAILFDLLVAAPAPMEPWSIPIMAACCAATEGKEYTGGGVTWRGCWTGRITVLYLLCGVLVGLCETIFRNILRRSRNAVRLWLLPVLRGGLRGIFLGALFLGAERADPRVAFALTWAEFTFAFVCMLTRLVTSELNPLVWKRPQIVPYVTLARVDDDGTRKNTK